MQSKWVGRELRHALEVQQQRGQDNFQVIPLSLDGTKLGVLEAIFDEEPIYISVSSGAGGVEAALYAILVAVGKRLPADLPTTPQPQAEPQEELKLELTDLRVHEQDGVHRAVLRFPAGRDGTECTVWAGASWALVRLCRGSWPRQ